MGMLDRYRKTGGFLQLLMLLETCGPVKQAKFLEMIAAEDNGWADHIRNKMLNIQRIYGCSEDTLAEIVGSLQDLTVAVVYQTSADPLRTRIQSVLSHSRLRKIEDMLGNSRPSPQEVVTTQMKVIEAVRKMSNEGQLRLEKIDPALVIDDDIDDRLARKSLDEVTMTSIPSFSHDEQTATGLQIVVPAASLDGSENQSAELHNLRKKMSDLSRENTALRHELSILKGKLDQIKKIA